MRFPLVVVPELTDRNLFVRATAHDAFERLSQRLK
jgi:hypothetical protein